MRLVSIDEFKPDMVLAYNIYDKDRLMLSAGQKNIAQYKTKLMNMGILHVYIEDEVSEGIEIPDVISFENRQLGKQALQKVTETLKSTGSIDTYSLQHSVTDIMEEILNNPDVLISLNDISKSNDYTFTHSISTTVYALTLGKHLGLNSRQLQKLGNGAILHDIGKTLLDQEILYKPSKLSDEEFVYIQSHTTLGFNALQQCNSITQLSKIIALEHHERIDGSGYPKGLKGEQVQDFSKIVAIADVYDALISDRCYRKRWSNKEAADFLMSNAGNKLDLDMVSLFIQHIAIYPNGTTVTLSTGEKAIIKEQNSNVPLRPIVRIISNSKGKPVPYHEIDLMEELSITILD